MNPKCNPVHKKGNRNLFCPYYGDCLDYVIEKFWKDWDCGECPHKMRQDARREIQFTVNDTMPYYELAVEIGRESRYRSRTICQ